MSFCVCAETEAAAQKSAAIRKIRQKLLVSINHLYGIPFRFVACTVRGERIRSFQNSENLFLRNDFIRYVVVLQIFRSALFRFAVTLYFDPVGTRQGGITCFISCRIGFRPVLARLGIPFLQDLSESVDVDAPRQVGRLRIEQEKQFRNDLVCFAASRFLNRFAISVLRRK